MASFSGTLLFTDGSTKPFEVGQYELGQAEIYAAKMGLRPLEAGNVLSAAPVLLTRYCAYANVFRSEKTRPAFDAWDKTLDELQTEEQEPENPTLTGALAETSQD